MDTPSWTEQQLPRPRLDRLPGWDWELHRAADLTRSRTELKAKVLSAGVPLGDIADAMERLLLAYEELASNGFRHGEAPVETVVIAAGDGWLIDVTDAAFDQVPIPAVDRDPAFGGLGLHLIARLCEAYGWSVTGGRKHVWGYVGLAPVP